MNEVIPDAKRMIGQPYSDRFKLHSPYWAFEIKGNKDGRPVYVLPNKTEILPEKVSTELLKVVKQTAQNKLGGNGEIKDCVITIPAHFTMEQKQATQDAAKEADLNVLFLITEPIAAAYAYGFNNPISDGCTLFVFGLGGGTLNITIVKYEDGNFIVQWTDGDNNLGGRDFDDVIFEHLKQQIPSVKFDDSDGYKNKIRLIRKCEEIKIKLSQSEKQVLDLEEFDGTGKVEISQNKFKDLTKRLMDNIARICERAMNSAGMNSSDIDKVLLIGGASKMKIIKDFIKELFPKEIYDEGEGNRDEAIAVGAAIKAAQLKDPIHKNSNSFINVLPIGVGIGLVENRYSIVVNRGTPLPTKVKKRYFTSKNNQETVDIVIYEGERLLADKNRKLGEIHIDGLPPGPAGAVYAEVIFEFDQNGILTVHAKGQNGEQKSFKINYGEKRDKGEAIEDLIRQFESCRVDDKGKQTIADARAKLLQNIEYIRDKITENMSIKDKERLEKKCHDAERVLNEGTNDQTSIGKIIHELEDEAKEALKSQLLISS